MKIAAVALVTLLLPASTGTEYEALVSSFPPSYIEGGCEHGKEEPEGFAEFYDATVRKYSWSIVTADAADRMTAFIGDHGVVDFGAGSGYVSHVLAERGADVLAFDNWSWGKPELWFPVQQGGLESLQGHDDRVLLMSWPPRDDLALMALDAWHGDRLIYAGEILRRTASYGFHEALAKDWHLVERIKIPQWANRSDEIFLFERGAGDGMAWMITERDACKGAP